MKKILVIGSLNLDTSIKVKAMPKAGETILGMAVSQASGGKGANQAYAAGMLGGDVSMLGSVGNDREGRTVSGNLKKAGVDTSGIRICEKAATGQAFVTVDSSGQNSIIVIPGANNETTAEYLTEHTEYMDEADIIVMQFEIPFDAVNYVKQYAVHKGKILIVDPAPARGSIPESFWKGIDYLKPNETELEILSGRRLAGEQDICDAAGELIRKGVRNVIVSLGDKGCIRVHNDGVNYFEAEKVNAVDTTAAGDSFTGAFAVALSEGKTTEEAVSFAQKAASITVTRKGAQASIPSRDQVK